MATDSVEKLRQVIDRALQDGAYAERLFKEPEATTAEYKLSDAEKLVVKQMSRKQFEAARTDAVKQAEGGQLTDKQLAGVAGGRGLPPPALGIAASMILGRSITSAAGGPPFHMAGGECDCCHWKGTPNIGGAVILPAD